MNADAPTAGIAGQLLATAPPEWKSLARLLPAVSRSFSLTLRVLPRPLQCPIGLAYLLARAADSIADTRVVPRQRRLTLLLLVRRQLEHKVSPAELAEIQRDLAPRQSLPAEKTLLEQLGPCFHLFEALPQADRCLIAEVVITLTRGMEFDLTRFPGESAEELTALTTAEELDQYTYFVAGCVGPFWTRMCAAHLPGLEGWGGAVTEELGVRFGKGLQLCNILRDLPKDLRIGRCYLPSVELEAVGLRPRDLLEPSAHQRLRPLYDRYLDQALAHLVAGWRYTLSVPARLYRLRLACAWPILIGLRTLARLRTSPDILRPDRRIKIPRSDVYQILAATCLRARFDRPLNRYCHHLVQQAGNSP